MLHECTYIMYSVCVRVPVTHIFLYNTLIFVDQAEEQRDFYELIRASSKAVKLIVDLDLSPETPSIVDLKFLLIRSENSGF